MIKYELENEKLKYVRTLRKARHDYTPINHADTDLFAISDFIVIFHSTLFS